MINYLHFYKRGDCSWFLHYRRWWRKITCCACTWNHLHDCSNFPSDSAHWSALCKKFERKQMRISINHWGIKFQGQALLHNAMDFVWRDPLGRRHLLHHPYLEWGFRRLVFLLLHLRCNLFLRWENFNVPYMMILLIFIFLFGSLDIVLHVRGNFCVPVKIFG